MSGQDAIALAVVLGAGIYILARVRRWSKTPGSAACPSCTCCRPDADPQPLLSIDPLPEPKRDRTSEDAPRPPLGPVTQ